MVDVGKRKQCAYSGCYVQPSYGARGTTNAEFCSKHAKDGQVNVRSHKCAHEECSKRPSYGPEGAARAILCSEHALEGMSNLKWKRWGVRG